MLLTVGLVAIFMLNSCDMVEGITGSVLDIDMPEDPDFRKPQAEIVDGPFEGQVLSTESVYFEWMNTNESATGSVEYAYRLGMDAQWSDWTEDTWVNLEYIDEGPQIFQVKARKQFTSNSEQRIPASRSFTMDAVQGPALMFRPRSVNAVNINTFNTQLYLEEVEDVVGARFVVEFDPDLFEFNSAEVFSDSLDNLDLTIADYVDDDRADEGYVEINVAFLSVRGVNGSYPIGDISFNKIGFSSSQTEEIYISTESRLRDFNNQQITIQEYVPLVIQLNQ